MSVDKAKDAPPKKSTTENKIVEAKPEPSTKTEKQTGRDTKKARYGRGSEASIQSLQGQLERHFWKEEKAIALWSTAQGPVVGRWRCAGESPLGSWVVFQNAFELVPN
jgi:hypothetical protein